VLKRHRELSVRELIAALDKEFGWRTDRSTNRPVTWSLKEAGISTWRNSPEFPAPPRGRRAAVNRA